DHAHALLLRDAARSRILNGLGYAQHRKFQHFEPIVGDRVAGFAHEPLPLPGQSNPEATVIVFFAVKADGSYVNHSDDLLCLSFEANRPGPGFATLDLRQQLIANECEAPIGWARPTQTGTEIPHDFPVRKQRLDLLRISEFGRAQDQTMGFKR